MSGPPLELFVDTASVSEPRFTRDGRRLVFLSNRGGLPHAFLLDPHTGACTDLTPEAGVVYTIAPRPGHDELAYVTDVGGDEQYQIHLVDLDGQRRRLLAGDDRVIHAMGGWSADGRLLAYCSNARDDRYFDVHVLDVASGGRRCVLQHDGMNAVERFAADGGALVVSRPTLDTPGDNNLFLLPLAPGGQPRCLTPHDEPAEWRALYLYPSGTLLALSDEGREFIGLQRIGRGGERQLVRGLDWDIEAASVGADGRRLVLVVNEDGYSRIEAFALGEDGELGQPLALPQPPRGVVAGPSWRSDGRAIAFAHEGASVAPSIRTAEVEGDRVEQWRETRHGVDDGESPEPLTVRYSSFDGQSIPAYYYRPRTAAPPWPCLVLVHGGPESQSRPALWRRYAAPLWLLSRGVALLVPNVRGSTGYGRRYAHADDREKRPDAVADLLAAADWIAGQPELDSRRVGVMGPSYGGFMVLAALTGAPDRWSLGIDLYGVANFETLLEHTGPWRRRHRAREYGDDPALLRRISPVHQAHRIRAPLLVVQGDRDVRVPPEESEQIVAAVQASGGHVEHVVYPDEGHGIEQPAHRHDLARRIVAFCQAHL